ncbi:monooxygenase [Acetobacter malorum DSM 14337]|uniref:Monooxygenase n=1 Tax=Acetobacter malorum DSM 14337 TaxID=1307910 RepID=A0ABQ0PTF2_9PROT|nr:LLM class flavin-dependent oxidoreductase [Acetobacter malorum]KXV04975.1 hypothetical protein AD930_15535 [Acetobacter malorum]GBQ80188.1 monooxygenase [Acetobacter malorum DSM 14337]
MTKNNGRKKLTFGFLNRFYTPSANDNRSSYHTGLSLLKQAEQTGLSTGWVAQHHFHTETGALPSPLLWLAHAAQHTRTIRLGTAIIILPLEPALRLAEDAAVLDILSNGRLELGLGKGFDRESFEHFGIPLEERGRIYDDHLAKLSNALAGKRITDDLVLSPPTPELAQKIWESSRNIHDVALRGNGLILAPQPPDKPSHSLLIEQYLNFWRDQNSQKAARIAFMRAIIPGADKKTVESEIGSDILRYVRRFVPEASANNLQTYLKNAGVFWGHPDEIIEDMSKDTALQYISHFAAQVQTFSTHEDQASHRLRLYTEQIIPAVNSLFGEA